MPQSGIRFPKPQGAQDLCRRGDVAITKIRCNCGHVIVDIESPCDALYWATPDEKMDDLIDEFSKAPDYEHPTDLISASLSRDSVIFYQCPECERLLFFWDSDDPHFVAYRPETDD